MQSMQNKINCENRDLGRLRNKFQQLEIANIRLENCMTVLTLSERSLLIVIPQNAAKQASSLKAFSSMASVIQV
jgi:hypothetical protein